MDDPPLVRRFERFRNLLCDRQRLLDGNTSLSDGVGERFAFDQLHHQSARTATTMLRLRPAQRRVLVTNLPPLANLAVGSLLFGQFPVTRPYSLAIAATGLVTWIALYFYSLFLAGGE